MGATLVSFTNIFNAIEIQECRCCERCSLLFSFVPGNRAYFMTSSVFSYPALPLHRYPRQCCSQSHRTPSVEEKWHELFLPISFNYTLEPASLIYLHKWGVVAHACLPSPLHGQNSSLGRNSRPSLASQKVWGSLNLSPPAQPTE